MRPAQHLGAPASLESFRSAEVELEAQPRPVAAVECALAWPPPQEDLDSIERIELRLDDLHVRPGPKRELAIVSATSPAAPPAVAAPPTAVSVAIASVVIAAVPGPDVRLLNAQIRGLLQLIGRRPEDYPDAFIPVRVVQHSTPTHQARA